MPSLSLFPNTSPQIHHSKSPIPSITSKDSHQSDSDTDLESSVLSVENLLPEKREGGSGCRGERGIDGGRDGWICVVGGWFALFCTFGLLNSMGLFQAYYKEVLLKDYSASEISWIFTVQLFLMWAGGIIFGPLLDLYGTTPIALPCTIGCTFCIAMLSLCNSYWTILLAQGVGFGFFAAGLFSCGVVSVGQWFKRWKALVVGLVLSGSSAGGVIHPLYISILIPKIGFPNTVRVTALIIGFSGSLSCLLLRTRLPRHKWEGGVVKLVDWRLFKDRTFIVYCLGTWFVVWGLFSTWNYLPTMSLQHGFSFQTATYTIVVLNAASILGRILPAYLADRIGPFNTITIFSFLNAILLLTFWLPLELNGHSTHLQIFSLSAIAGFASGGCISVFMPCVAELREVETLGRRLGLYQGVIGVASLTSLPIQGALIPLDRGAFVYLILFSGVAILVGAVVITWARMLRVGFRWRG